MRNEVGVIHGALWVGVLTIVIALVALRSVDETFWARLEFY